MLTIQALIAAAQGFATVPTRRWPGGVRCPAGGSDRITKEGRDATPPERQRDQCPGCGPRFDDRSGTRFGGHHPPVRIGIVGLSFRGLNRSPEPIAPAVGIAPDDAPVRASPLREGLVPRPPAVPLSGAVAGDEVSVVAGPPGPPAAVANQGVRVGDDGGRVPRAGGCWPRRSRRSAG